MVIMRLFGGLGNQMFQYALGRAISLRNKTELLLDTAFYDKMHDRHYELDSLRPNARMASPEDIRKLLKISPEIVGRVKRHLPKSLKLTPPYVVERSYAFDPPILYLPGNVYMEGYWQSYRYFESIRDILLEDFSPRIPVLDEEINFLKSRYSVVAVHVRRGDYVLNTDARENLGLCSMEYYSEAISVMRQNVPNPYFLVFSDDTPWVEQNFRFTDTSIAKAGIADSYYDLARISQCDHCITANSSYSWWGAWLNKNNEKVVISPRRWFADGINPTKDLIPREWISI